MDFERKMKITVESSSDTKAVYASLAGSWTPLTYENGEWIIYFSPSPILSMGNYKILLHAIDYAGNVGTASVYFTVYNNYINSQGDSGQNNGTSSGSSGQGGSGTEGSSGQGGSSTGGSSGVSSGTDGSGSASSSNSNGSSFWEYLPFLLLAIGIIMVIVALMLMLGIFGFLLDLLAYLILNILFADVPEFLVITYEFFDTITSITSVSGFSMNAITMSIGFITGDVVGIIAGIFLIFLAYFVSIGVFGGLFGLFIAIIGFWLMMTSLMAIINEWKENKV